MQDTITERTMEMERGREDNTLAAFNSAAAGEGITYAEAQIRETKNMAGVVRVPGAEDGAGYAYMKISARNALKNLKRESDRKRRYKSEEI